MRVIGSLLAVALVVSGTAIADGMYFSYYESVGKALGNSRIVRRDVAEPINTADCFKATSLVSALAVDPVRAQVFWSEIGATQGGVWRADADGFEFVAPGVVTSSLEVEPAGAKLYFVEQAISVDRMNLDGSSRETVFATSGVSSMTLDPFSGTLYVARDIFFEDRFELYRMNLDGSASELSWSKAGNAADLAVDAAAGKIYWHHDGAGPNVVRRANLDGSNTEDLASGTAVRGMVEIDVSAGKIYFDDASAIIRTNLDGSERETFFSVPSNRFFPNALALDTDDVIVTNFGCTESVPGLGRTGTAALVLALLGASSVGLRMRRRRPRAS